MKNLQSKMCFSCNVIDYLFSIKWVFLLQRFLDSLFRFRFSFFCWIFINRCLFLLSFILILNFLRLICFTIFRYVFFVFVFMDIVFGLGFGDKRLIILFSDFIVRFIKFIELYSIILFFKVYGIFNSFIKVFFLFYVKF